MGQFSWLCATCDEQILSEGEDWECFKCEEGYRGKETVLLLLPKKFGGSYWEESDYEGYGEFGGMDAYTLLARMNVPEKCPSMLTPTGRVKTGQSFIDALMDCDEEAMNNERDIGINLFFKDSPNHIDKKIKYPIKIIHARCGNGVYEDEMASDDDPDQGWQNNRHEEGSLTLCGDCWGW